MEHIDNVSASLGRYFDVLERTGFYKDKGVNALLIYMFLVDTVLEGPLAQYLDDAGMQAINKVLRCIAREKCLISTDVCKTHISKPRTNYLSETFRISMPDSALRISENELPRITETKP